MYSVIGLDATYIRGKSLLSVIAFRFKHDKSIWLGWEVMAKRVF